MKAGRKEILPPFCRWESEALTIFLYNAEQCHTVIVKREFWNSSKVQKLYKIKVDLNPDILASIHISSNKLQMHQVSFAHSASQGSLAHLHPSLSPRPPFKAADTIFWCCRLRLIRVSLPLLPLAFKKNLPWALRCHRGVKSLWLQQLPGSAEIHQGSVRLSYPASEG